MHQICRTVQMAKLYQKFKWLLFFWDTVYVCMYVDCRYVYVFEHVYARLGLMLMKVTRSA